MTTIESSYRHLVKTWILNSTSKEQESTVFAADDKQEGSVNINFDWHQQVQNQVHQQVYQQVHALATTKDLSKDSSASPSTAGTLFNSPESGSPFARGGHLARCICSAKDSVEPSVMQ